MSLAGPYYIKYKKNHEHKDLDWGEFNEQISDLHVYVRKRFHVEFCIIYAGDNGVFIRFFPLLYPLLYTLFFAQQTCFTHGMWLGRAQLAYSG